MIAARRAIATAGIGLALAGTAFAAEQIAGRDRAPAQAAVTISSSAPLFSANGLIGGEEMERCTVLRNEGPQPADVTLFGTASVSDLSPWLDLELVRGSLPDGTPAGDCTGFAADAADYGAGTPGVIFRGTLANLPDGTSGIADPARWAVGEVHAYQLRMRVTAGNAQQGLQTIQDFNWGITPFDDRPPESFADPVATPAPAGLASGAGSGTGKPAPPRQCTVVSFGPGRPFVGARAIIKARATSAGKAKAGRQTRLAELAPLGIAPSEVVGGGESLAGLSTSEVRRRAELLHSTRRLSARRQPVMVVRITRAKGSQLTLRVGLRKRGRMSSPRRWQWVRMRLNATPTKSTVRWPFASTARMSQLRVGYNQIDLTLNRGRRAERIKGLPRLARRSFAFVVRSTPGQSDCILG